MISIPWNPDQSLQGWFCSNVCSQSWPATETREMAQSLKLGYRLTCQNVVIFSRKFSFDTSVQTRYFLRVNKLYGRQIHDLVKEQNSWLLFKYFWIYIDLHHLLCIIIKKHLKHNDYYLTTVLISFPVYWNAHTIISHDIYTNCLPFSPHSVYQGRGQIMCQRHPAKDGRRECWGR